jgi:hypothetical protein
MMITTDREGCTSDRRSFHPADQVVGNPNRIGDDRKRRIHSPARREEGTVDDIEVVEVMSATIEIEDRSGWIVPEPAGAILMTDTFDVDVFFEMKWRPTMSELLARPLG